MLQALRFDIEGCEKVHMAYAPCSMQHAHTCTQAANTQVVLARDGLYLDAPRKIDGP